MYAHVELNNGSSYHVAIGGDVDTTVLDVARKAVIELRDAAFVQIGPMVFNCKEIQHIRFSKDAS